MTRVPEARSQTPLMRAFVLFMLLQVLLLGILVAGVWKYTADILSREDELATNVLPNLELAHDFISATSDLQSQGLLLESARSAEELELRKGLLEESIRKTRELIQSHTSLTALDTLNLADTIGQVQEVALGLSDARAKQLLANVELDKSSRREIEKLDALLEFVQERVVILTSYLLETREVLAGFSDERIDNKRLQAGETVSYDAALNLFETNSLTIQDYLLFSQDLISFKSVLERLPLIRSREDIAVAEQTRDLLMQAMVSRVIYIGDQEGSDLLLTSLHRIRQSLRAEGNLFAGRLAALNINSQQQMLSTRLAQLTTEVPIVTEQIRSRSESMLLRITAATRQGLERYRWFMFLALVLSILILGSVGYWLLYRRTVMPLGEIAARLDDVGTERFSQPDKDYFIREIQLLSQVLGELDTVQRQMQQKDLELKASNHELRNVNADLEQFVHVASHDLQEPLRKLQQFSGLLVEDYLPALDGDGLFYLEAISKSAKRMSSMIRDTLAYARSGRNGSMDEQVNLNTVLQAVCDDLDVALAESGAVVQVAELPTVIANSAGMSQLFGNLLFNAIKYRRQDTSCQVTVEARYPEGEEVLVVDVRDTGVGIEECFLERVFVPFERLDSQSVAGTGLGLAICAKVCDAHGWRISVTSQVGVGSCFHIMVPREFVVS